MDTVCLPLVSVYVMDLGVCACVFFKLQLPIDCPKLLQWETHQKPDIENGRRPSSDAGTLMMVSVKTRASVYCFTHVDPRSDFVLMQQSEIHFGRGVVSSNKSVRLIV